MIKYIKFNTVRAIHGTLVNFSFNLPKSKYVGRKSWPHCETL